MNLAAYASLERAHLEAVASHYAPELVRARVDAATCDITGLAPGERVRHVENVTATVLSLVRR